MSDDAVRVHIVQRKEQQSRGTWVFGEIQTALTVVESKIDESDVEWRRPVEDTWVADTPDGAWVVESHAVQDAVGMITDVAAMDDSRPYPE